MKRLFPIFLVLILLCGCSAQKSDFELPYFSKSARISCRGFEYDCKITYSRQGVEVDVLSTAAKGLNITYNGSELAFSYGNIKISEPNNNFELTNPAIAVFDIVISDAVDGILILPGRSAQAHPSSPLQVIIRRILGPKPMMRLVRIAFHR